MKNKLIKISKRPFIRNVIILSSGTVAAQVVSLLLTPIISRLYGPDAYGLMGTFVSIMSILTPVAALTFPIAIVLPKRDSDAKGLVRLSLYITTAIAIVVGLILLFFHQLIASVFQLEAVAKYLFLMPIVILCAGFLQVMEQWLIRTKQFAVSAKVAFLQALIVSGGKVGIGFFHPVSSVLIVFSAFAQGLKAFLLFMFKSLSQSKLKPDSHQDKVSIKEIIKEYKDFPLYRAPEVFLNAISRSLPILLLTSFFGPASAGFYYISRTVLGLPSQLIGKSVGDVFYPRISEAANNNEKLETLIKKATLSLGIVGAFPYGIVILFGPWLFSFVFGPEWVVAGEYARWMALSSYVVFMNKPSMVSFPVLSAQKMQLYFTIVSLLLRILALLISYYIFNSDLIAVISYCVINALLNLILIYIAMKKSRKFDSQNNS